MLWTFRKIDLTTLYSIVCVCSRRFAWNAQVASSAQILHLRPWQFINRLNAWIKTKLKKMNRENLEKRYAYSRWRCAWVEKSFIYFISMATIWRTANNQRQINMQSFHMHFSLSLCAIFISLSRLISIDHASVWEFFFHIHCFHFTYNTERKK